MRRFPLVTIPRGMVNGGALAAAAIVATASCGSEPTAAVCTRSDEGSPCGQESTATQIATEHWEAVFRTTVVEQVEYMDGGVQCALTRRTCVTLECTYARSPSFPEPDGWYLQAGDAPADYWGNGGDTAEDAIAACGRWWELYG